MTKKDYTTEFVPKKKRVKTSIYVDGEIWKEFVKATHEINSTSCHFLEPYMLAVVKGIQKLDSKPILPISNITFNMDLNVQRVVRRRKILGNDELKTVYRGDVDHCSECGETPVYMGGHRADPFTYVKKYLCEFDFKMARKNKELEHWDRVKSTVYYYEPKEKVAMKKGLWERFKAFVMKVLKRVLEL